MLILRAPILHTGDGLVIRDGEIAIENGVIRYVGPRREQSPNDDVREFPQGELSPGLIDAHTHLGLMPEGFENESKDLNEMTSPKTPTLDVLDGIWPEDKGFAKALRAGITSVCILPGSANIVGGAGGVFCTQGHNPQTMRREATPIVKIAFGYAVKHSHGLKGHAPLTRMAIADLFRKTLDDALVYEQRRALDQIPEDPAQERILSILQKKAVVRAHALRSDDLLTALRLQKSYGFRLVLEHALDAPLVAQEIADAHVPVVFGPALRTEANSEVTRVGYSAVPTLLRAGVKVALMTDHPIVPCEYLSVLAGLCRREGLDHEQALQLCTKNAAEILGLKAGRLAEGYAGDVVCFSGAPLAIESRVQAVFVAGELAFSA